MSISCVYFSFHRRKSNDFCLIQICPTNWEGYTNREGYRIGNLIALEIVLNNEAADKAYADKLDIYKESKYNWLKEFFEGHPVWDFNGLDTRANDLAELYYTKILGRAKE